MSEQLCFNYVRKTLITFSQAVVSALGPHTLSKFDIIIRVIEQIDT